MQARFVINAKIPLVLLALSAGSIAIAQVSAAPSAAVQEVPRYEAANPGDVGGDRLAEPRRLAAAIVAQGSSPKRIVEVGSFTGEFLEAFLEQFPRARGQWTEPVATNRDNAHRRLTRFGNRVEYVIGCAARDLADGCVKGQADTLITSWLSIHQNREGIARFYREATVIVPVGGWIAVIDHVRDPDTDWQRRLSEARAAMVQEGFAARLEGPPVHHADWIVPTLDEQISSLKAAGFAQPRVIWRRLDTVMILARK